VTIRTWARLVFLGILASGCSSKGAHDNPTDEASGGASPAGGSSASGGAPAGFRPDTTLSNWSGTLQDGADSIKVGFQLRRDANGSLTGNQLLFDPATDQAILAGSLTGRMVDDAAMWSTQGGVKVSASLEAGTLKGTLTFPRTSVFAERTVSILVKYTGVVQ
jgi:hypothetical protein